jgi:two-component system phosphate regulon sensor histidine kinase PhoR
MKKRNISLITGLMVFALLGVMAMQFYFLRQSYMLQLSLFDSSVKKALDNVVDKISNQDADHFLIDKSNGRLKFAQQADSPSNNFIKITRPIRVANHSKIITRLHNTDSSKAVVRNHRIAKLKDSVQHLMMDNALDEVRGRLNFQVNVEEYTDELGNVSQKFIPQITARGTDPTDYVSPKGKINKYIDTTHIVYIDPQFGRQVVSVPRLNPLWLQQQDRIKQEQQRRKKAFQVKQVLKLLQKATADTPGNTLGTVSKQPSAIANLEREYQRIDVPLKERLSQYMIDTLLRAELRGQGIDLPFSYDVSTLNKDSVIFSTAFDNKGEKPVFIAANTYETPIFKNAVIDPGKIQVSFPQKNSVILSRMTATMATTGGLLFVLIFCFAYTIYSILKQKKVSEMKTDFINNMTHEFKTPVSTIMIASEALKDAEIAEDKNRVAKLANIIYEENVRLGSHIERVLNIARIEKDDFKLDVKTIDVNETITTVLDSMLLKLQKHDARIDLNLTDEEMLIKADELHFSNVLYNLIDNAIKYSNGSPEITIGTQSKNGQAIIRVADKGIGMSPDQQAKIFEQFYRIPTGNLHDVKGFGLGLSYVNTIVKRLNGTISVRSEREKGSEFELKFTEVFPAK